MGRDTVVEREESCIELERVADSSERREEEVEKRRLESDVHQLRECKSVVASD